MVIDGYVVSDRKGKWSEKPIYWFMGILFEKYFFHNHYQKQRYGLKATLKNYIRKLNLILIHSNIPTGAEHD